MAGIVRQKVSERPLLSAEDLTDEDLLLITTQPASGPPRSLRMTIADFLAAVGTMPGSYHLEEFTNKQTVTVNHGLGRYPSVRIIDSALDEVEGDIDFVGPNQIIVSFSASFSGKVICS